MTRERRRNAEPPDGGWGWVIVAAAFFINFLSPGLMFSIGIIFDLLIKEFNCSKFEVSAMASICFSIQCLMSPIVAALHDRYGARVITCLGGFVCASSLMFSAFAPNIYYMYPVFGIYGGTGMSLICLPLMVIISHYFDKKLSIATAFGVIGVFVGCFLHPYILRFLISIYGWRGAIFISGALSFNSVPASMLLRPLKAEDVIDDDHVETSLSYDGSNESPNEDIILEENSLEGEIPEDVEVEQNSQAILEKLVEDNIYKQALFNQTKQQHVAFPKMLRNPFHEVDFISNSAGRPPVFHRQHSEKVSSPLNKSVFSMNRSLSRTEASQNQVLTPKTKPKDSSFKRFISVQDHDDRRRKMTLLPPSRLASQISNAASTRFESVADHYSRLFLPSLFATPTQVSIADLPLVISRLEEVSNEESVPDDGKLLLDYNTDDAVTDAPAKKAALFKTHVELLLNPAYIVFVITNMLICSTLWVPSVYIVDWGATLGINSAFTTTLLSFVGFGNIVGRPIVAVVADCFSSHRKLIFLILLMASGVISSVVPFFSNAYTLAIFVIQFAFLIGGTQTLLTPVLADLIPLSQMAPAFGILLAAEGVGILCGPPLLGLFASYAFTFSAVGWALLGGAVIMLFGWIFTGSLCCSAKNKSVTNQPTTCV